MNKLNSAHQETFTAGCWALNWCVQHFLFCFVSSAMAVPGKPGAAGNAQGNHQDLFGFAFYRKVDWKCAVMEMDPVKMEQYA